MARPVLFERGTARVTLLAALAFALVAAPPLAMADAPPPRDRFRDRPHALTGVLGLGAPTGVLGIEYEHALAPWLAVAGAAGAGTTSPQAAATTRLRALGERVAASVGFGASYGGARIERFYLLGADSHAVLRGAVWLNVEFYLERRRPTGQFVRAAAGAGRPIRTASCQHFETDSALFGGEEQVGPCSDDEEHGTLPFIALAVGQSF